ncbi:MAG: HAD-IC family P-type ATPase [Candidatus Saccharimonadales bacterium]
MDKTKTGLSSGMLASLRARYGYNEIVEKHDNLFLVWAKEFWGPLPWLLELTAVLTFFSGNIFEGIVILALLLVNSIISITQRSRTDKALAQLRKTLQIMARVLRDGKWQEIPARELLPGDVVRLRVGDIVTADMNIADGSVNADQSSITGESLPVELGVGQPLFSGSTLMRGEATAIVDLIGTKTKYGTTAELLETSHAPTHTEKTIFTIIKYQFFFNLFLIVVSSLLIIIFHWPQHDILTLAIILLVSSVPVAFPAMFTVAQTFGALQMAHINNKKGVLVRRLASVQDGAIMNVLCTDKTGTLTQNKLSVAKVIAYESYSEAEVTALAAACSNTADQDPIDAAVFNYATSQKLDLPKQLSFTPFDPLTKKTEASVVWKDAHWTVYKGLPAVIAKQAHHISDNFTPDIASLSKLGYRVIAVSASNNNKNQVIGLIALADPIRDDSKVLLDELKEQGIAIKMITGDNLTTAQSVADTLQLSGLTCKARELKDHPEWIHTHSVFAEAYPEDKLLIITTLQKAGYTVAMTGDGVNDAPALRQAEVGIAVANATDIAKNSASFILTNPGLKDIVVAVTMSRRVYVRIRTWALNKIIKSFEVAIFTSVAFFITKSIFLTPLLVVLILFANDFVTISIATDNAIPDKHPATWRVSRLMVSAGMMAVVPLTLLAIGLLIASHVYHIPFNGLQTLTFLIMVFLGQANLYAVRGWPHFWQIRPSKLLARASVAAWGILLLMGLAGIIITRVPFITISLFIVLPLISLFIIDQLKLHTPISSA